ncbi:IS1634 family transposase [Actinocrinis puniceicyclus]|uniref:IS1634 family transposase n=1 Tax=Actinocrinis puniceicyclus TaxID=977794 RepID=A0A8J7WTQ6_9ACTN|nr:IS1634 family transposase [Actinocrinis puniceicyclus]MBS2965837.1 IS1634 family transposase [Actinocrinis puniceicyclus]
MASLYAKRSGDRTYWYLREMARVDGKPTMVSERYLGTAAEIASAVESGQDAVMPQRSRHLAFGAVAAGWRVLERLGVTGIIDAVTGPDPRGAGVSRGTYLVLAALGRLVEPGSKAGFADWWKSTAADRFTRIPAAALDHRRFWDAMHSITVEQLAEVERRVAVAMVEQYALEVRSLALDMTNFATYIDTANARAPIAQRGKAKQKRADLRLVGLGLVVTRDGGIPLVSHPYPGNRPDVTQFTTMVDQLVGRYHAIAPGVGLDAPGELTVVFDAGQNSQENFTHFASTGLHFVGSIPPSDCPDLLEVSGTARRVVDGERFGKLTAFQRRREVYGRKYRVILTHSPNLHAKQSQGFDQSLSKAGARLRELAARLERGRTRRAREAVEREIEEICHDTWVRRVIVWTLTGDDPKGLRLTWHIDITVRASLEREQFGKRVLVTTRDAWSIAEVVAAYRSQSDAEFAFRQLKDPHVVSFSPMYHWTDHNIRVHVFTCVLALQIAHLMRREAGRAGLHLSVRALLDQLAGIGETVLIYPAAAGVGRPKVRRMLTETTPDQDRLASIFQLDRYAPAT